MHHTFKQYGTFSISLFIGMMILIYIIYHFDTGDKMGGISFVLIELLLAVALLLFYCLTVEVGERTITLKFGIGLIRKTIRIEDLERTSCVRNKWWYGFGIRLTPHGWMWNISGLDAIELYYKGSNTRFRIGTGDCQKLKYLIDACIDRIGPTNSR